MVSCARATRGLGRNSLNTRSGRPSSPPSREKIEERCSVDVRREGQSGYSLLKRIEQAWRDHFYISKPSTSNFEPPQVTAPFQEEKILSLWHQLVGEWPLSVPAPMMIKSYWLNVTMGTSVMLGVVGGTSEVLHEEDVGIG